MLFFQFFLLVGYLYAYLLTKFLTIRLQLIVHLSLLTISLFLLPNQISDIQNVAIFEQPTWAVLAVLCFGVGFPYFVLSGNTPLLQHWFTNRKEGDRPFRLYAISNVGSFIALVSYPILVEPFLSLDIQLSVWSSIYWLFVFLIALIFFIFLKQKSSKVHSNESSSIKNSTPYIKATLWFLFSALGVVILISSTNAVTQNVPPVPFLWIAPLSIYLLTYIAAFSKQEFYIRKFWIPVFILLSFVALFIYFIGARFDIITQLLIYMFVLLCGCMICHGELSLLKPEHSDSSLFYLILSAGGVFGSLLVSFAAKNLFDEFLEFPIAIFCVFALTAVSLWWQITEQSTMNVQLSNKTISTQRFVYWSLGLVVVGGVWGVTFFNLSNQYQQYDVARARNFYGILSVKDIVEGDINERRLIDGTTSHGSQSLLSSSSQVPRSYYRPGTGVQLVIEELSKEGALNAGIIGLGVGALAAYAKPQDHYTFYELNPKVAEFADKYFSYLNNAKADVNIKLGDARVTLQKEIDTEHKNAFDLLVIDAFSGDLIPTHLMTQEAFLLYQQHLSAKGTLALHISNRHLSLLPIVIQHSVNLNMHLMLFDTPGEGKEHDTQWVVMSNNKQLINSELLQTKKTILNIEQSQKVKWTDDYSSLLPIIKVLN